MEVIYKIANTNLKTEYGIYVSGSKGLIDIPVLKERVTASWPDQHGDIVDMTDMVYQSRRIELDCFMKADDWDDMIDQFAGFKELMTTTGLKMLTVEWDSVIMFYLVYLTDTVSIKKRFRNGQMVGQFTLSFLEPEPVKKVIKVEIPKLEGQDTQEVQFDFECTDPLNFYWGDGDIDRDFIESDGHHSHVYDEDDTYYCIITGRIENINAFGATTGAEYCEVLWDLI